MYKYIFRFTVTTLTILTANLITSAISALMVSYKYSTKPVTFTIIGMLIIVVIFYPLFIKLEEWITSLSAKLLKGGKSLAGKYLGLIFSFLAGFAILIYFYAKMWYHVDLVRILFQGNIKYYL